MSTIHPLAAHFRHDPAAARDILLDALSTDGVTLSSGTRIPGTDGLATASDAAATLQVPPRTVDRWILDWGLAWAPLGRWHLRDGAATARPTWQPPPHLGPDALARIAVAERRRAAGEISRQRLGQIRKREVTRGAPAEIVTPPETSP